MSLWVLMTFKVFVHPTLFVKAPAERKEHINLQLKSLQSHFQIVTETKKNSKELD